MVGKYKLIAVDMDGTLLNSKKEISARTLMMIKRAVREGKKVALSTGRGISELTEYLTYLPEIEYLNCTSGAVVYDWKKKKMLYHNLISPENVKQIMEIAKKEDTMFHILTDKSMVQKDCFENMAYYQMGIYQSMFEQVALKYDNIYDFYKEDPFPVAKCNIYHVSPERREKTIERMEKSGLPVAWVCSEISSLEISQNGVNKGNGLLQLCNYLGISPKEVVAVGDSDNDEEVLKLAGLAIAMGNANARIKALSDIVVSDCDHDGCAEAIEKYFLEENPAGK